MTIIPILDQNLGRCPLCMRKAFLSALAAWALVVATAALSGRTEAIAATAMLALAFTGLWLAHICALSIRATMNRLLARADASHDPANYDPSVRRLSRRRVVIDFATTLALTAAATILPRSARSQAACGCRVGDICCNAGTHVTWQCQDVNGCTQWILTGNACTPTSQNQC
ncbi:MAG TPA: DUF3624 family protein [Xanthobacteraceae bacterium]|nr:DUF3624 family protein [Xanthobacteraceae bacterium]